MKFEVDVNLKDQRIGEKKIQIFLPRGTKFKIDGKPYVAKKIDCTKCAFHKIESDREYCEFIGKNFGFICSMIVDCGYVKGKK